MKRLSRAPRIRGVPIRPQTGIDLVKLHKEVRETLKDLVKYQEKWSEPEEKMVANTINILKVEMSKESPETWKRVKQALLEQADGEEIELSELMGE